MQNSFLFSDTFLTIESATEAVYKEKGSKFLAFASPISSETEAKELLADLRKQFFDATHHCFAYALGRNLGIKRQSDDGEPNGTAGMPILNQIKSKKLTNILVVVVRYYGGTKLGAAGLVNAYKTSASECLANALIVEKIVCKKMRIFFEYLQMNEVMKIMKENDLQMISQKFDNDCQIILEIRESLVEKVQKQFEKIKNLVIDDPS
ncbi:MAG: YigZ family protein [Bacteroidetes bacterium]|nr:MAG: YigZ family protein [Bacteroidota bacterium]